MDDYQRPQWADRIRAPWALATLLLGAALLFGACGRDANDAKFGTLRIGAGESITLGLSAPLSGDEAALGRQIERGVRVALAEFGAVQGYPVTLQARDDRCAKDGSLAAAAAFAEQARLAGVVGPACDAGCIPAAPRYDDAKIAVVSPSCVSAALPEQGFDTVFRTAWNGNVQAYGIARFIRDGLRVSRVYAVHDESVYGKDLAEFFKPVLLARGGGLAGNEALTAGQGDFDALAGRIAAARPAVVVFFGFAPEAVALLTSLRGAGVAAPFIGSDGVASQRAFVDVAGAVAEGAYLATGEPRTGDRYDAFAERYQAMWQEPPAGFSAQAYDAARVLLLALGKSAKQRDGALLIDRHALRDAIAATDSEGATGRLRFLASGDRLGEADTLINRVQGGAIRPLAVIKTP